MGKFKDFMNKLNKSLKKAIYSISKAPNFENQYGNGVYEKIAKDSSKMDKDKYIHG